MTGIKEHLPYGLHDNEYPNSGNRRTEKPFSLDIESLEKDLVQELSGTRKDILVKHTLAYFHLLSAGEKAIDYWTCRTDVLDRARQVSSEKNSSPKDLLDWIEYLINFSIRADRLLSIDESAMESLAKEDPKSYKAVMKHRNDKRWLTEAPCKFTTDLLDESSR